MTTPRTTKVGSAQEAIQADALREALVAKLVAQDAVRSSEGIAISAVSAPRIQEQAGLRPGLRVLEIGSGGYHAALLAERVGEDGEVTTVDIDPEVVDRARSCLTEVSVLGSSLVSVVRGVRGSWNKVETAQRDYIHDPRAQLAQERTQLRPLSALSRPT